MTSPARARLSRPSGPMFAVAAFVVAAVAVFIDSRLSLAHIAYTPQAFSWPYHGWLDAFSRYDTGWYYAIADKGYFYNGPGQQSAVAYFPAYPTAMRVLGAVAGDAIIAGVLITLASGLGVAVVFFRWCSGFLGARTARLALALLLLYPFAFYLFGAVYSDALFLFAVLVAFSLVEADRPLLAGVVGMVATAARPVGVALVVGLVIRQLELSSVLPGSRRRAFSSRQDVAAADHGGAPVPLLPRRVRIRALQWRDAGVGVSVLGLVLFCALLWQRFDEPFAFLKVGSAAGWYREVNLHTITKIDFYRRWEGYGLNIINFWLTMQGVFTVAALAAVPAVIRRFGWGYGVYVLLAVGMAAASSPDFVGMGRYVLAAFPAFAALADLLLGQGPDRRSWRRWAPAAVLCVSGLLMAWMASLFARWYFLA